MSGWNKVLDMDELWEDDMTSVEVAGTKVLLINNEGEVHAYLDRCPHQDWPLSTGDYEDGILVCANHLWEFDVKTGKGVNPGDCKLTTLPCKVEDDAIFVQVVT